MGAAVVSKNGDAVIWSPYCRRRPRAPLSDPTKVVLGQGRSLNPDAADFRCILTVVPFRRHHPRPTSVSPKVSYILYALQ